MKNDDSKRIIAFGLTITMIVVFVFLIVILSPSRDNNETSNVVDDKVPDDIEIVDYDVYSIEGYNKYSGIINHWNIDRYDIEGVVKNNLRRTLDKLTIIVTFYDGYRIAYHSYNYLENLAPTHSTEFKVSVSDYSIPFAYTPDRVVVTAKEGHIKYIPP